MKEYKLAKLPMNEQHMVYEVYNGKTIEMAGKEIGLDKDKAKEVYLKGKNALKNI